MVEVADDQHNSITIDYQYEKNNYSDSQFFKDYVSRKPENSAPETMSTDGGYCGMENNKLAESKSIRLVTTDLKGADVSDHWADFEFNETGTEVLKCAGGHKPKSCVYDSANQRCKVSFPLDTCRNCPYYKDCHPKEHKRVATVRVAMRTVFHAIQQRYAKTDEFRELANFRNGIETVPAALRKRHHVDKMPVRGYIRTKLFFGFKVAGMKARKLIRYMISQADVRLYPQTT